MKQNIATRRTAPLKKKPADSAGFIMTNQKVYCASI